MSSPFIDNYRKIKGTLTQDTLLLVQLGDFFEAFDDDAKTIAKTLNLVITKRMETPMCGIPVHASRQQVQMLNDAGYQVYLVPNKEAPTKKNPQKSPGPRK